MYHYTALFLQQSPASQIVWEPVVLRDYQEVSVGDLRKAYAQGYRAICFVSPTASGKTVIFAYVVQGAVRKGIRVLILVHRHELLWQAVAKLRAQGIEPGIIQAGTAPNPDAMVQVASIQTISRRLDKQPEYGLTVVDECHHARASQYIKLFASQPKAKILGVTATPARLDGRGLGVEDGGPFECLVLGAEVDDLVERGYLSKSLAYVPEKRLQLSGVRIVRGDYATDAGLCSWRHQA